ncbi:hypothetical protein F511_12021 [Dorcoceras hygrometricum]|uniref:Uncharacterized protein n=1 Tax=Dorcoceras hygrometricum TaxID=472368 RepID=A0A2Z7CXR9_9LAMI|nr:hypothetical protein F511_12021 [Dorcoceras hygrometricum]
MCAMLLYVDLEVLATGCTPAADYNQRTNHLLNLSAKAKRCRINLFKRHRFATAIFKYHLLPDADYNQRTNHLLNLSAKAKRCRINLFKRHRFATAIFKYHLLLPADCDVTADPALALLYSTAEKAFAQLLIVMSLLIPALVSAPLNIFFFDLFLQQTSQFLFQLVHLFLSACSWFLSFQLIHFAPAGSTWPPPDYEQLT